MMEWLFVIGLVLFGLGLIIVEIIFIPGTTFVGIVGLIFSGFGIYLSYDYFGSSIGTTVLIATGIISLTLFVISIRSGVWSKFALKGTIKSKVNEGVALQLAEEEQGITVSALRPIGKAEFNNRIYEVKTSGNFLEAGEKVKITKIQINKIFVEQVNN